MTLFYNGPASWEFVDKMSTFYGTGYTPYFFCDGIFERQSWNRTECENAVESRLAVPAILDIEVFITGDSASGQVYYDITAEEDLQSVGQVRLFSVLFENDIYCTDQWSAFSGLTVDWIPRMSPVELDGVELQFTGPYPQTVSTIGTYSIEPEWEYENMGIITFVIDYSTKEVFNASYYSTMGEAMGTGEASETLSLRVGPNPSSGTFTAFCTIPSGISSTIDIFDVTGRKITSGTANDHFTVQETGLYIVKLSTETGIMLTETVAVII